MDEDDAIPLLAVDNAAVLRQQLEKLATLKANRDPRAVELALTALENGGRGKANLLELSVAGAACPRHRRRDQPRHGARIRAA